MSKINNLLSTLIVAAILLAISSIALIAPVQAHESGDGHTHEVAQAQEATQDAPADFTYAYTAQADDTYTQFARKAVQTYGKINNVNLSVGQIMFVETTVTQAAGSPVLNLGEKREIKNSDIKSAVEMATKLSQSQVDAWAAYAAGVDLNTDTVGQN